MKSIRVLNTVVIPILKSKVKSKQTLSITLMMGIFSYDYVLHMINLNFINSTRKKYNVDTYDLPPEIILATSATASVRANQWRD